MSLGMIITVSLTVCLLAAGLTRVNAAGKWSYVGKSGPLYWHEIFPEACGGKNQSPIDLKPEQTMYHPGLKDFAIWYDPPRPDSKMYIKNTGYTVQVDLKGEFYVTNAGLGHVYKAVQFHFHWGHKAHHGSEHLVDGKASPIEMHIVTYNHDRFSNIGEAVKETGGLAVLGVLFEISKEDNPSFDYIIRGMRQIRNPDKVAKIELPLFSLRDMLPHDITRYYRYNGSLTTPGCFETVTWSVFDQMQTISHKQMEEFRKLLQFRRHHHSHKDEAESGAGGRHKRELSQADKDKEHNAKLVLEELGVAGKDSAFERKALKQELVNSNGDKQQVEMVPLEGGAKTSARPQYIQDNIVNNFRPVQPVHDRVVYRSFKLRESLVVDTGYNVEANPNTAQYKTVDCKDKNGAASTNLQLSSLTLTILISLLATFYTRR